MEQRFDTYSPPMLVADERGGTTIAGERHGVTFAYFSLTDQAEAARLPEHDDAYLLIDDTMRRLVEIVYAYEGTIERFTPDGFLALFGVPFSHENDPERAVRAVLDMQTVARELAQRIQAQTWGLSYQGIVHTAQVEVGNISPDLDIAFIATDDAIEVLLSMHRAAPPNKVVVTTATQRHVRGLFELDAVALPPHAGTLHHEVFEVRGVVGTWGNTVVRSKPMIGRHHELQQLHDAWTQTFHNKHSQWVFLSGESGIGKSLLMTEFHVALSMRAHLMHSGVCMSHTRHRSLGAIAALLRDMLGISIDSPQDHQAATLDAAMHRLGLSYEEVAPFLRTVLGLPQPTPLLERRMRFLDPAVLQRQTHAALRQVLVAQARVNGSIFMLEDIQWLDPASQAFLHYLLQSQTIGDATLMFVLVARAGVGIASLPLLDDIRAAVPDDVVEVHLDSLTTAEQNLLLEQLLPLVPEADPQLRNQITLRAHGNPLYLEQIVQMLSDQNAITQTTRGWQFTARAANVLNAVPDTIHALMLARFDLLAESLRRLLQKAAICRTAFPLPLLAALETGKAARLGEHIAELETRLFLLPDHSGDEPTYNFNHALLQEVIYDTLLSEDRQSLHDRAAAAIGEHTWYSGYERVETLAYHYTRGTEPFRAVPYLVDAAEHAAHRYANDLAIEQYQQAMTLMQKHPAMRARYFAPAGLGLGRARKFAGEWTPAFDVLHQTLAFVKSPSNPAYPDVATQVQTLCEMADVRFREGAQEEAVGFLETAQSMLLTDSSAEYDKLDRLLADRLAVIRFRQGKLEEAFALAQQAVRAGQYDAGDDPLMLASAYNTLGGVMWQQGRLPDAVANVEQSRIRYEEIGYSFGVATALMNLGILLYTQGHWHQAAEYFERSDKLRRDIGHIVGRANNLLNLALLRMAMGDHELAESQLRESLMISKRLGDGYGVTRAQIGLGYLAIVQDRLTDATDHLDHAEALLESAGEDETVQILTLRARMLGQQGQVDAGLALTFDGLAVARSAGVTEQEGECLRVQGVLYALNGDFECAEDSLQASLAIYRAADDRYQTCLTLIERSRMRVARVQTCNAEAESVLDAAINDIDETIRHLTELDARYDLDQARCLLAEARALKHSCHEAPHTGAAAAPQSVALVAH